jgi:hypothetical protein
LEWILNTPAAHRVHHASNLEYLDGNYGGVLIVFDRLFGTYIAERAVTPCRFGLIRPMTSYNLLVIEFHHWGALWRDLRMATSVSDALGYIFKPPGWRPDGSGETTEDLRRHGTGVADGNVPECDQLRIMQRPADSSGPNLTFGTRGDPRLSGRNRPEATIRDGCVRAEMPG